MIEVQINYEYVYETREETMAAVNFLMTACDHPHWFAVKLGDVVEDMGAVQVHNAGSDCLSKFDHKATMIAHKMHTGGPLGSVR